MRTRNYVSSMRTPGRMHRHSRRVVARRVAAGDEPAQTAPCPRNARDCCFILRGMYTHVRYPTAVQVELLGRDHATRNVMNRRPVQLGRFDARGDYVL